MGTKVASPGAAGPPTDFPEIVNGPGEPWPLTSGDENRAYVYISQKLTPHEGGIRPLYGDALSPVTDWYAAVSTMRAPDDIPTAAWTTARDQVLTELKYVDETDRLFQQLNDLSNSIQIVNDTQLQATAQRVELSTSTGADGKKLINVLAKLLMDRAVGMIAAAVPPPGNVAVALAYAAIQFEIDQRKAAQQPGGYFRLAYADLADFLAEVYLGAQKTNGDYQAEILANWGRLRRVGDAITSGAWLWPDGSSARLAELSAMSAEMFFYQTLMPAKWQIIDMMFIGDIHSLQAKVPPYALRTAHLSGDEYRVEICNAIGITDLNKNLSPFPAKELMDRLWELGFSREAFFLGEQQWRLPRATITP